MFIGIASRSALMARLSTTHFGSLTSPKVDLTSGWMAHQQAQFATKTEIHSKFTKEQQFETTFNTKFSTLMHIPTNYMGDTTLNGGPTHFYLQKDTEEVMQHNDKFGWTKTNFKMSDFFANPVTQTVGSQTDTNIPFVTMGEKYKKFYATLSDRAAKFYGHDAEGMNAHMNKVAILLTIVTTPMVLCSNYPLAYLCMGVSSYFIYGCSIELLVWMLTKSTPQHRFFTFIALLAVIAVVRECNKDC
jgi:hypothetical protein